MNSSMRVIFVRLGIAKIEEKPIPEQLGDMPIIALNDFRADLLIRTDDFAILFGVELRGQFGGIDQVTKHQGELPSFRVGSRRCSRTGFNQRGGLVLGGKRLCWLSR